MFNRIKCDSCRVRATGQVLFIEVQDEEDEPGYGDVYLSLPGEDGLRQSGYYTEF
jgi:hypothetical protein